MLLTWGMKAVKRSRKHMLWSFFGCGGFWTSTGDLREKRTGCEFTPSIPLTSWSEALLLLLLVDVLPLSRLAGLEAEWKIRRHRDEQHFSRGHGRCTFCCQNAQKIMHDLPGWTCPWEQSGFLQIRKRRNFQAVQEDTLEKGTTGMARYRERKRERAKFRIERECSWGSRAQTGACRGCCAQVTYNRSDREPCTGLGCHGQEEQEHLHR